MPDEVPFCFPAVRLLQTYKHFTDNAMSQHNPIIPLIANPTGLDKRIQLLQQAIGAGLPWLEYSFGRATVGLTKGPGREDKVEARPEVYMGSNRYACVEPNSHWAGHSFIQVTQPEKPVEFVKLQQNQYTTQVELVVLFDLEKVKLKMDYTYEHRFTEEIKQQIKDVLRRRPEFTILAIHETPQEVLRGYTYNHHTHQTFRHPEAGVKFVLDVAYMESC